MNGGSRIQLARASQVVAERLRTMILLGEFGDVDRLPPAAEFAEQLGISQHHLREALRLLEQDGLIQIRRGHTGGIFLAIPEAEALARTFEGTLVRKGVVIADLITARTAIEVAVVELAAQNATEEDIARLESILEKEREDYRAEMEVRGDFHLALIDASRNVSLSLAMRMIFLTHHRLMVYVADGFEETRDTPGLNDEIVRAHRAILRAVKMRDAERAANVVRMHAAALEPILRASGIDPHTATLPDSWPLPRRTGGNRLTAAARDN